MLEKSKRKQTKTIPRAKEIQNQAQRNQNKYHYVNKKYPLSIEITFIVSSNNLVKKDNDDEDDEMGFQRYT